MLEKVCEVRDDRIVEKVFDVIYELSRHEKNRKLSQSQTWLRINAYDLNIFISLMLISLHKTSSQILV